MFIPGIAPLSSHVVGPKKPGFDSNADRPNRFTWCKFGLDPQEIMGTQRVETASRFCTPRLKSGHSTKGTLPLSREARILHAEGVSARSYCGAGGVAVTFAGGSGAGGVILEGGSCGPGEVWPEGTADWAIRAT
jgi:hypothetical protein